MSKVLVVDDNEANRYLLEAILQAEGLQPAVVNNGEMALECLARERPDLVVSDILMPGMDGFSLCKRLRSDPQFQDIPFLFYTATYTDPQDEEFALSLGADAFLLKPQEPRILLDHIQRLLRDHQAGRLARQSAAAADSEKVFLKEYNQALIRKLEDKLVQLEDANRTLVQAIKARQEAEAEVRRINSALEQRIAQRTAELAQANRELEAFSYSVSHDLRAPLRNMSGFVRWLQEDRASVLSGEGRECLEQVKRSIERMNRLIDGLLSLSRNDVDALKRAPLNTTQLVETVRQEFLPDLGRRAVRWIIHPLPEVYADESCLRQVWANLIDNALKYSRTRITSEVEIGGRQRSETGEVELFIRDNGVGFDMSRAESLFEVFRRLHAESEFEGLGIGLANVRRIVERHGGKVWAESQPGVGTTFFFTLPPRQSAEPG